MKRNMDLIRKILVKIEDTVDNAIVYNPEIEGYSNEQISYHCSILYEGGYISKYGSLEGSGEIEDFGVGRLTWEGHDLLDKIRSETVWKKTKDTITNQGLPMIVDVVKDISTSIISAMVEGAIKGMNQ